jgi:glycosyltransferase involved in cell wall biosynthesis
LVSAGWFSGAAFSVILPPPVERSGAAPMPTPRAAGGEPVFGIYDPGAAGDLFAFVARAIDLTGRRDDIRVRIAAKHAPRGPGPMTVVEPGGIDEFLATIDVLVVPAYHDAAASALIAALRAGKSVIVPDCGGAAELIEYGRHGVMFAAGSVYHLANAMNLIGQSWQDKPVLLAEGGPAIAKTHPTIVAQGFAAALQRLVSARSQPRVAGTSHG